MVGAHEPAKSVLPVAQGRVELRDDLGLYVVLPGAGLQAPARVLSVVGTDYDNGRDLDLVEAVEGAPPRLFRNLRAGTFRDVAGEAGLGRPAGTRCVAVGDVNKDSYPDFFFGADAGDVLALSNGRHGFSVSPAPDPSCSITRL